MAEAIKISQLPVASSFGPEDVFVVNDITSADEITSRIAVGSFVNWITSQDLKFTGTLEISEIIPDAVNGLDVTVNSIYIKDELSVDPFAVINGIELSDLDDVNIDGGLLEEGSILTWDSQSGYWVSSEPTLEDAPLDGGIYARQNGQWVDITDSLNDDEACRLVTDGISCIPDDPNRETFIGEVFINSSIFNPGINQSLVYTAVHTGNSEDVRYNWSVEPAQPNVTYNNTMEVVYTDEGTYTVTVTVSSSTAVDVAVTSQITEVVAPTIGEISGEKVTSDPIYAGEPTQFIARTSGTANDLVFKWSTIPDTSTISQLRDSEDTAIITFEYARDYIVNVEVESPTTVDSPQSRGAILPVNIDGQDNPLPPEPIIPDPDPDPDPEPEPDPDPPSATIGRVNITRYDNSNIALNEKEVFIADAPNSTAKNLEYTWSTSDASVRVFNYDQGRSTMDVEFTSYGSFYVYCDVTSPTVDDSSRGSYKINVPEPVAKCPIITIPSNINIDEAFTVDAPDISGYSKMVRMYYKDGNTRYTPYQSSMRFTAGQTSECSPDNTRDGCCPKQVWVEVRYRKKGQTDLKCESNKATINSSSVRKPSISSKGSVPSSRNPGQNFTASGGSATNGGKMRWTPGKAKVRKSNGDITEIDHIKGLGGSTVWLDYGDNLEFPDTLERSNVNGYNSLIGSEVVSIDVHCKADGRCEDSHFSNLKFQYPKVGTVNRA